MKSLHAMSFVHFCQFCRKASPFWLYPLFIRLHFSGECIILSLLKDVKYIFSIIPILFSYGKKVYPRSLSPMIIIEFFIM